MWYIGYVVQIISILHRIKSDPHSENVYRNKIKTVYCERLQIILENICFEVNI